MSKAFLVGGLAALTLAAAGGVAMAQQAQDRPGGPMRADTDGDSRISRAEFVGRRVERLSAADTDRDGAVSAVEMRAAGEARRTERADARFERLDADASGAVSRSEFAAAGQARAERGGRRSGGHRGSGRAMGEHARGPNAGDSIMIADARARAEQGFARLDGDSDGYITAEEGRVGHRAMREQHRRRMTGHGAAHRAATPSPQAPITE